MDSPLFAVVLDSLPDIVVAINAANHIVYVNRAAERLLGWPGGTLVGEPVTAIQPEALRAAHDACFQRCLATRVPGLIPGEPTLIGRGVLPALCRDGTTVEIAAALSVLVLPGGEVVFTLLGHPKGAATTDD